MTATLIILAVSAILFVLGPIRSDLVAVCAAIALVLAGVLTPEEALSGFSNPIVIMMVGLFVVGGGIFSTGLAKMMGSRILSLAGTSETRLFVLLMLTTGGVGAFVSNTGTVALMLPIVVSMARAAGLQSSRFLMPLAFAGSMGGMLTLIGTPPNLVIRDALIHAGYGENVLSFFSFTPVGIVCLIVGILVLLPLSRRFLSKDTGENVKGKGKTLQQLAEEYQLDERLTTLKVTANSPVIGKTAKALNLHDTYGVTIVEIRREGGQKTPLLKRVEQYASADTEFADGDTILLSGPEDQVKLFAAENALLRCKKQKQSKNLAFYSVGIAEILLMSTSEMVGKTIRELDFRARYGVNVLGVRRHSDYLLRNIGDIRLHASDVILVQGPWETISGLSRQSNSWVVLGEPLEAARRVTLDYKAPLAAVIMLLMVLAMAIDAIPISMHSWQGDDLLGFEGAEALTGGIQATGNYPGRARTADELRGTELVPFRAGIAAGAGLVMISHMSAPNVTGSDVPCDLSPVVVTDLLRGELGFAGVVITDSHEMGAITEYYTPAEAAVLALQAGCDIVLMPENLEQAVQGVLDAAADGSLTQARIDESVLRILTLKLRAGICE